MNEYSLAKVQLMIKFSEYIPIPSRICEDFEKDKKTAYNIKKFK
jgi:hypothetical protein